MRPSNCSSSIALAVAFLVSAPAYAQDVSQPEGAVDDADEIIVVAEKLRGQVDAPQPPILVLNEQDIAAYGAGSLAELIEVLAPQTGSGRGRGGSPAFLVNGMRISSFREMRSYPPEAIKTIEILPEEVAQKYGFSADQRVINIILKDNFTSKQVEVGYGQPGKGGYSKEDAELTYLHLQGVNRFNVTGNLTGTSMLTEAERNILQTDSSLSPVANDPNPAAYRSLVSKATEGEVTANWSRKLAENGASLSLNGTYELSDTTSLQGLNSVRLQDPAGNSVLRTFGAADPLENTSRTSTYSLGSTFNAPLGNWDISATLDSSFANSRTFTDRDADTDGLISAAKAGTFDIFGEIPDLGDAGRDTARTKTYAASTLVTAMGSPLTLPAGDVSVTLDGGFDWKRIESADTRNVDRDIQLTRGDISAGANVGIPIASRREGVLDAIGDLYFNLSGGVDRLSDFGTLANWSAGFTWGVTPKLTFTATHIAEDTAPTLAQLGNPEIVTSNVQVYDLLNDETVLARVTSGGNPDLSKQSARDWKFGLQWELPFLERSNINIEYFRNRTNDVVASFPTLTPAIEAAFPDRVTRDADGMLIAIDQRPITFDQQKEERIDIGINLSGSFGKAETPADGRFQGRPGRGARGDRQAGKPADSTGAEGSQQKTPDESQNADGAEKTKQSSGGRRSRFGPPGGGKGRWFVNLTNSIELRNRVWIAESGPVLDLLEGDALSSSGNPRYSAKLRGGMFYRGFGLRADGTYTGKSHVDGTSSNVFFDDLITFDVRLFVDLGQQESLTKKLPLLKNSRISFKVDNVFDARQRVTNNEGEIPLRYQPYLIDPTGRFISLELRKLF
ncbi:TonB-dependent receptor [Altererythrobacter indicus]|uniref:TonB-dependent receptor n=1 Tax=Altericroceibacterium indicum TaxID=374177 RepID=A0A845A459_9SPHN|nr:TonB-dependent receptor [Altericroceibacterium indicum]MXP25062.1 TonB-dependent receptor [Altericroceibacterium indicum]